MVSEVLLRDATEADLPILFEQQLDPAAGQMAAFAPRDRDAFMQHWGRILGDAAVAKQAIVCDGQIAGNIVCYEWDGQHEVGYWIGRAFWGRGVATQALAAFLGQVATRPLYAHVATHNVASRRVLEKCGFVIVGFEEAFTQVNGENVAGISLRLDDTPGELTSGRTRGRQRPPSPNHR